MNELHQNCVRAKFERRLTDSASWDAVTITWKNGQVARVHHGDMREIH